MQIKFNIAWNGKCNDSNSKVKLIMHWEQARQVILYTTKIKKLNSGYSTVKLI